MGFIFGLIGIIAIIIMFARIFRNERKGAKGRNLIEQLKQNPELVKDHLSGMIHTPFYVNMDQIPQYESAIKGMPETFRIGGSTNVNYWQIVNSNEVFMVVAGEHSVMAAGLTTRTSTVNETVTFNVIVRPNKSTGNYEMKTRTPNTTDEKSVMAMFGKKFFDALKERG